MRWSKCLIPNTCLGVHTSAPQDGYKIPACCCSSSMILQFISVDTHLTQCQPCSCDSGKYRGSDQRVIDQAAIQVPFEARFACYPVLVIAAPIAGEDRIYSIWLGYAIGSERILPKGSDVPLRGCPSVSMAFYCSFTSLFRHILIHRELHPLSISNLRSCVLPQVFQHRKVR